MNEVSIQTKNFNLICSAHSCLRARAEGVEHVEEDEAGEGHGGVARRHLAVLHHVPEHPQRAADDDRRREQHVQDQTSVQDLSRCDS